MWQHYDGQDVGSHVGPSHRHWTMEEMAVLSVPFSRCDSVKRLPLGERGRSICIRNMPRSLVSQQDQR
jgi:hypothetical protein